MQLFVLLGYVSLKVEVAAFGKIKSEVGKSYTTRLGGSRAMTLSTAGGSVNWYKFLWKMDCLVEVKYVLRASQQSPF